MEFVRPQPVQPIPPHAQKVFQGVIFGVYQWSQELFDGQTTTFEKLTRADCVTVIPVTPDGRILVIEQEQPGSRPIISCPGGTVEPGEDPITAAARELREETGYCATSYQLFCTFHPMRMIDWVITILIGKNAQLVGPAAPDGGERICHHLVSYEEFLEIASDERFGDKAISSQVLRARLNPQKTEELRLQLLS